MKVKVSKEATRELQEASTWYEIQVPGLGHKLIREFEAAINQLKRPYPPLLAIDSKAAQFDAKKLRLKRFPFSLIVIIEHEITTVVALAHHSRKPNYWKQYISTREKPKN